MFQLWQREYAARSSGRLEFDGLVLSEVEKGKKIKVALRRVSKKRPELARLVANESEADTRDYFDGLLHFAMLAQKIEKMKRNAAEIARLDRRIAQLEAEISAGARGESAGGGG